MVERPREGEGDQLPRARCNTDEENVQPSTGQSVLCTPEALLSPILTPLGLQGGNEVRKIVIRGKMTDGKRGGEGERRFGGEAH